MISHRSRGGEDRGRDLRPLTDESARGAQGGTLAVCIIGQREQLLEVGLGQSWVTCLCSGLSCPGKRAKAVWQDSERAFEFFQGFSGLVGRQQKLAQKFTH